VTHRRDLALVCLSGGVAAIGATMLGLLVPLVALRFGATPAGIGLLIASAYVLPLGLAMPMGAMVDRWGARRVMRFGLATSAFATLPMALAPSLTTLVVAHVAGSLSHLLCIVGSQALIAALGEGRGRESAYGWFTTSLAASQMLGPLLAGLLLDARGPGFPFLVMAVLQGAALLITLPTRVKGRAEVVPPPFKWAAAPRLLSDRTVTLAMLTSSAAVWAMAVTSAFLPVRLDQLAIPAVVIGGLMSLRGLAAVVIRPQMSALITLLGGRERTVLLTLLAIAASLVGVGLSDSVIFIGLWLALFGAGTGLSQPVSIVMVADRVAAQERGAALGLRLMGNQVAQLLAPIALVVVAERAGLPLMFALHGGLVLAAALLMMRIQRTR
jgi:MFS family permease